MSVPGIERPLQAWIRSGLDAAANLRKMIDAGYAQSAIPATV